MLMDMIHINQSPLGVNGSQDQWSYSLCCGSERGWRAQSPRRVRPHACFWQAECYWSRLRPRTDVRLWLPVHRQQGIESSQQDSMAWKAWDIYYLTFMEQSANLSWRAETAFGIWQTWVCILIPPRTSCGVPDKLPTLPEPQNTHTSIWDDS